VSTGDSSRGQTDPLRAIRAYGKWVLRARPADYLIALSAAPASLPVVGRHVAPIGGMAALGVYGSRYLPDMIVAKGRSRLSPGGAQRRKQERSQTNDLAVAALQDLVPATELAKPWPVPLRMAPMWKARSQRHHVYRASTRYGAKPSQLLDVWRRKDLPSEPAPVMVYVPGGAWVFGSRVLQGHALMSHLAELGWICLSVEYRTSPQHRWPAQILDVKAAIAWARANVAQYGGDPNFIAITGCSAGGHLAALAALTPDDPQWQSDLPDDADTSVDAVVSMYGRYDWEDRSTAERNRFMDFLERVVVKRSQSRHPETFRSASPLARVRADAPPFLVIHGSEDGLIPVEEARVFVDDLRSVSDAAVSYVELPGAGHGFDLTDGARTGAVNNAIGLFLDCVARNRLTAPAVKVV
jgi:acetyl esterase/lipase